MNCKFCIHAFEDAGEIYCTKKECYTTERCNAYEEPFIEYLGNLYEGDSNE